MNKIGLHIIGGFSGSLGKPRVVKLVDASVEYVRQVRQEVGPACIIVVRWYEAEQPLADPLAAARAWFARRQPQMTAMASGDSAVAFEGYNEIGDGQAAAYAAFEVERLRLMHQAGLRAVVGNFSVGTPHESLWGTAYKPLLAALGPGDFLGLHEYWENAGELDNRWLCGRWTLMPELKGVPIIITEVGRGSGGWKASSTPAGYLAELEKYNALLEASPNVLGGVVYTSGGYGWDNYHPDDIWPQVVGKYSGGPWSDPSYPQPKPAPAPAPVYQPAKVAAPGVQYQDWYGSPNHSSRGSNRPAHIVIHDAEGSMAALKAEFANPYSNVSAHDAIDTDGTIVRIIGYDRAAWHCGGSHIDGVPDGWDADGVGFANKASIGVELIYPAAPASPPWPPAQLRAAVLHVRELCRAYGISRDGSHIHRHGDIDPARRSDPRNLDWGWFLAQVGGDGPVGLSTGWPHDEPATDPGLLQDKIRWWTEQAVREIEAGYSERGHAILLDLIDQEHGLMYRLERALKH